MHHQFLPRFALYECFLFCSRFMSASSPAQLSLYSVLWHYKSSLFSSYRDISVHWQQQTLWELLVDFSNTGCNVTDSGCCGEKQNGLNQHQPRRWALNVIFLTYTRPAIYSPYISHILRLPATTPVSLALKWTPEDDRRRLGRPKRTWQDTLKEDSEEMGVDWSDMRETASDRARWRQLVARCCAWNRRN